MQFQFWRRTRLIAGLCGCLAVVVFSIAFTVIGLLNHDFDFAADYISKLGATGQIYSFQWNAIGFGFVGFLLAVFGWLLGVSERDPILGFCLSVAGLGFAFAAIPTDLSDVGSSLSRAHHGSICLSLAGWCGGLARLTRSQVTEEQLRWIANLTIAFAIFPIICCAGGVSSEPVAHRFLLLVALAWVMSCSWYLWQKETGNTRVAE